MGPNSPSTQAAQHHELHEGLEEELALVLVVVEVLEVAELVLVELDPVKGLVMVEETVLAGQDNLQ